MFIDQLHALRDTYNKKKLFSCYDGSVAFFFSAFFSTISPDTHQTKMAHEKCNEDYIKDYVTNASFRSKIIWMEADGYKQTNVINNEQRREQCHNENGANLNPVTGTCAILYANAFVLL